MNMITYKINLENFKNDATFPAGVNAQELSLKTRNNFMLESHKGGENRTQLTSEAFNNIQRSDTFLTIRDNINQGLPIFINDNNLSHEVSVITSAICFHLRGHEYNNKLIINFDHHSDSAIIIKNPSTIQYSNWGDFVEYTNYKIIRPNKYKYLVIGDTLEDFTPQQLEDAKKKISEKINELLLDKEQLDIYITIDTDVYKGSGTSYGDGSMNFEHLVECLNYISQYSSKLYLCGADITGLLDKDRGWMNERQRDGSNKRTFFFKNSDLLEEQKEITNHRIKALMAILEHICLTK